jgi:hypothetical protein
MSRQANTLLVLGLASGLCYGLFIVPWAVAPDPRAAEVQQLLDEIELLGPRLGKIIELNSRFPDGLAHDFGKVQRGILACHAFRIVNTADVPLRIIGLRIS